MQDKKMKLFSLIFLINIIYFNQAYVLLSQMTTYKQGYTMIKCSIGSASGASYFERNGNRNSSLYDSIQRFQYTFDNSMINGSVQAEYGITDNLLVRCSLPFTSYSLIEKFTVDSIGNRVIRKQMNTTLINYCSLGGMYSLLKGKTIVSLLAEYRVPTYQGNPLDSTSDFLGGLSKEALIGLHFHIPFEKSWIAFSGSLSLRDSAWQNLAYIHSEIGFSTVEKTALIFFIDIQQAMGASRDIPIFEIRRFQPAEQFTSIGASFKILPDDHLILDAMYSLRVMGTNAWSIGNVALGAGYRW